MAHPRINWTIPAPVILAIIAQAGVMGWVGAAWKTTIEKDIAKDRATSAQQFEMVNERIGVLEKGFASNAVMAERVKGVEVNVEVLKEQSVRIENKLDTLVERRK